MHQSDVHSSIFYVATQQGEPLGLLQEQEIIVRLNQGQLTLNDRVWQKGMSEWQSLEIRFGIPPALLQEDTQPDALPTSQRPNTKLTPVSSGSSVPRISTPNPALRKPIAPTPPPLLSDHRPAATTPPQVTQPAASSLSAPPVFSSPQPSEQPVFSPRKAPALPPPLPQQAPLHARASAHPSAVPVAPEEFTLLSKILAFGILGCLIVLAALLKNNLSGSQPPGTTTNRGARPVPVSISPSPKNEPVALDDAARHHALATTLIALHGTSPPYPEEVVRHLRIAEALDHPEATYLLSVHRTDLDNPRLSSSTDSASASLLPHLSVGHRADIIKITDNWHEVRLEGVCRIKVPPLMESQGGIYGIVQNKFLSQSSFPHTPRLTLQQKGLNALDATAQTQFARLIVQVAEEPSPFLPPAGEPITASHLQDLDIAMRSEIETPTEIAGHPIVTRLLNFTPSIMTRLEGRTVIYTHYRRQVGTKPPVTVHSYQFNQSRHHIIITLSYRDNEASLWRTGLFQSLATLTFDNP